MNIEELENIIWLVENGGEFTIGSVGPYECAAVANDEDNMLAAAVRRQNESISELLVRVDASIEKAWDEVVYLDELNN